MTSIASLSASTDRSPRPANGLRSISRPACVNALTDRFPRLIESLRAGSGIWERAGEARWRRVGADELETGDWPTCRAWLRESAQSLQFPHG